jgi:uroporphyrinogen III methyltransferase/synthase
MTGPRDGAARRDDATRRDDAARPDGTARHGDAARPDGTARRGGAARRDGPAQAESGRDGPGRAGSGRGVVYLVGAGPGDPGLVTVRGLELVARADVLAYDRLIPPGLVGLAPEGCERVDVGKYPGRVRLSQAEINRLLVEGARAGRQVVRLKGGDPFVFGRGGEEAEACARAGVRFEVVPGVTAAIAGPAYAGIPVTHPGLAAAFAVVTGHEQPGKPGAGVDWEALARVGTVCVLMTVASLERVAGRLLAAGRSPATPAALVERATMPAQRVLRSTLGEVAAHAREAAVVAPAMLVVGEVAALAGRTTRSGWPRPAGPTAATLVRASTRASRPAALDPVAAAPDPVVAAAADRAVAASADRAVAAAADRAVAALAAGAYEWTALVGSHGVAALRGRVEAAGLDARVLARTKVAAVGPTAEPALRAWGIAPDLVPSDLVPPDLIPWSANGGRPLAAALPPPLGPAPTVLLAQSDQPGPELAAALREAGWTVDELAADRPHPA